MRRDWLRRSVGCVKRTTSCVLWCVSRTLRTRATRTAAAAVLVCLLCENPSFGHTLNVYATVEGNTIRGEVYFRGRVPARQAKVVVSDPQDEKLGETTTDDKGMFTYETRFRCDHRLVAKTSEGHAAECVIAAAELPDDLPLRDGTSGNAPPVTAANPPQPSADAPDNAQLEKLIEQAVARQVAPLQRELREYRDRTRLTDVVGGIGYILGITGMLFYLLGVRKKGRAGDEP